MTVTINGTTGYTGPIGAIGDLSTTGNTTLGDASGDTLTINGSTTTFTQGTANGVAYLNGSKVLTTGSALVFDGTNLGVGVVPSAWSGFKALQIGTGGALSNPNSLTRVDLSANWYYNGSQDIYIGTGAATLYRQNGGQHIWFQAGSGTGGTAISFTQALTLDASGNLSLASGNMYTAVNSGVFFTGSVGSFGTGVYGTSTNNLALAAGGSERARIDASGNLGVGTTSPSSRLHVQPSTDSAFNGVRVQRFDTAAQYAVLSYVGGVATLCATDTAGATPQLRFSTSTDGSTATERARIDSSGTMGIGITNPSAYSFNGATSSLATSSNIYCVGSMFGYVQSRGYALQDTGGGGTQWTKMGTFYTPSNQGWIVRLEISGHVGFNANLNQNEISIAYFKTSNNSSSQSGSTGAFYGDGMFWRLGPSGFNAGMRAVQVSTTEYQIWIYQGGYSNGSYYTVSFSDGCGWTHSGAIGTPSGNYITLTGYSITYT